MTGDSCLKYQEVDCGVNGHAQLGVSGGGSLIGGHERGGVMLDRLEHLLPIPTGAEMDRWRKMVIQRIERKKG